jgi:hypothetical protein
MFCFIAITLVAVIVIDNRHQDSAAVSSCRGSKDSVVLLLAPDATKRHEWEREKS